MTTFLVPASMDVDTAQRFLSDLMKWWHLPCTPTRCFPNIEWTPALALIFAMDYLGERWPLAEALIAQDPYSAYCYAKDVIKGRFPEAETLIARHSDPAYEYARDVIKGRFPKAERVIARNSRLAYLYAKDVIKGRFLKAEGVIARVAHWAYLYAKDVIKGRFPKAEGVIAQKAHWAYLYAKDVIKARFPEAEKAIADSGIAGVFAGRYFNEFGILFDDKALGQHPSFAYLYAREVLNGRLPSQLHKKMQLWAMSDEHKDNRYLQRYLTSKKYQ